ncbi:MAG: HD domain-containing protein [Chloroflexi bacterium]|nr:HD domain-containing protein [Chloroflexota bacterium]
MRLASRALYRSRQFFGSVRPRVDEALREQAFALLNDSQRTLFSSMTTRDQQHCLDVYNALREKGHDDSDLLIAALLHDAGKGTIELWHRVAFVVLERLSPRLLDRIARPGDGGDWRQALHRCRNHPELGAELARQAGSSERVVTLISEHGADDRQMAALKAADESV